MTINSLQLNQSAPFNGLGTLTHTVVSTGLYTMSFKSFLPFIAAGGQPVTTQPSAESTNVTCAADSSGSKNSTWWKFYAGSDLQGFYVWYNINAAGVDPAPTGLTGIEVAGATGATAATLATASIAAIVANTAANTYVAATAGTSGHLILTNRFYGGSTNAANGTASYGASFSVTEGSFGDPAVSGLDVTIKNGSTVLARYGNPTPTQPILGGSLVIQATAADVLTVVFSSLSAADNALNAVKSVVNFFQGE